MSNKLAGKQILRRFTRGALGFIACLWIIFSVTPAFAQGACAAVARIYSPEGFVFVSAPATPGQPANTAAPQLIPVAAGTQADVCAEQSIQTGPRSNAMVLLFVSNQAIRLDQNTTMIVRAEAPQGQRTVIELLQGLVRLSTRLDGPSMFALLS